MWRVDSAGVLLAQCSPGQACELPKGLPWYFGLLIAGLWLAVLVGIAVLGRRVLGARIERRRDRRSSHQRALEETTPGNEIERW